MFLFKPDGTVERVEYKAGAIREAVGGDFDVVRIPRGSGYVAFVNDTGLLDQLPRNIQLEIVCCYAPLAGNGVVVSFEESGEHGLLPYVDKDLHEHWTAVLEGMVKQSAAPRN